MKPYGPWTTTPRTKKSPATSRGGGKSNRLVQLKGRTGCFDGELPQLNQ